MDKNIIIKEDSIEMAAKVNATIVEFDQPYDQAYFENRIKNKEKLILIAYIDNQPVGHAVAYNQDDDGSFYCLMAGVNPLFRRLGILNKLMRYLEDWAKARDYKKITLKTRNNRRAMLAYLIKAGFNFIKIEPQPAIEDNRILLEKQIL